MGNEQSHRGEKSQNGKRYLACSTKENLACWSKEEREIKKQRKLIEYWWFQGYIAREPITSSNTNLVELNKEQDTKKLEEKGLLMKRENLVSEFIEYANRTPPLLRNMSYNISLVKPLINMLLTDKIEHDTTYNKIKTERDGYKDDKEKRKLKTIELYKYVLEKHKEQANNVWTKMIRNSSYDYLFNVYGN